METLRHADSKKMDDVDRWVFGRQEMFALEEGDNEDYEDSDPEETDEETVPARRTMSCPF